jgi:predicted Zn-dependent protease
MISRTHFETLAEALASPAAARALGADRVSLAIQAEQSDFIRFNRGEVRQATAVDQTTATLTLVRGQRRMQGSVTLSGQIDADVALLRAEGSALAEGLAVVPDDPYLLLAPPNQHSAHEAPGHLPAAAELIETLAGAAKGHDLVGFHASGPMVQAVADSTGSRHWHRADSFCTEWCLYAPGGLAVPAHLRDKAIKAQHAGRNWQASDLAGRVAASAARVPVLLTPPKTLAPGEYRAAFSAAAMGELIGVLAWSGFSLRERRHGTSSLSRFAAGELGPMSPQVQLREATADGLAPSFSTDGFVLPPEVVLVRDGLSAETLNGPRAASEYSLIANCGSDDEAPNSLHLSAGSLPSDRLLQTVGTGLWISNLWYLNYSERSAARVTGMTRFACFWVEGGEAVAPIGAMRFDDSLVRMLGSGLVGLADHLELQPNTDTYDSRQWSSTSCPAAVIDGFRLTL